MMEKKVKIKQQNFKQMMAYPDQSAKPQAQAIPKHTIPYPPAIVNTTNEELIDLNLEVVLMGAILSRG